MLDQRGEVSAVFFPRVMTVVIRQGPVFLDRVEKREVECEPIRFGGVGLVQAVQEVENCLKGG